MLPYSTPLYQLSYLEVEVNLRPTVSRPVCLGVRRPSGTCDQFFFLFEISFRQLRVCYFVAPSLTRGQVCNLLYNCFWALPEQSLLGRSPSELTALIYCLIWDSPNLEGQVPLFISPRNRVAQLYPRGTELSEELKQNMNRNFRNSFCYNTANACRYHGYYTTCEVYVFIASQTHCRLGSIITSTHATFRHCLHDATAVMTPMPSSQSNEEIRRPVFESMQTEQLTIFSELCLQAVYLFAFTNVSCRGVWEEQGGTEGIWRLCMRAQQMMND
jgi:hypothetical protein